MTVAFGSKRGADYDGNMHCGSGDTGSAWVCPSVLRSVPQPPATRGPPHSPCPKHPSRILRLDDRGKFLPVVTGKSNDFNGGLLKPGRPARAPGRLGRWRDWSNSALWPPPRGRSTPLRGPLGLSAPPPPGGMRPFWRALPASGIAGAGAIEGRRAEGRGSNPQLSRLI
jgi:hypothetical protein